jgi:excisionase family DNA binding protein
MSTQSASSESSDAQLLKIGDVCQLLKISKRSVWRLISAGQFLPPVRVGRSVRWRRAEVEEWVKKGCPKTPK